MFHRPFPSEDTALNEDDVYRSLEELADDTSLVWYESMQCRRRRGCRNGDRGRMKASAGVFSQSHSDL
ncbi:guanine nucleotide exchange factor VAV2 isoform X1 [Tachysurus ichikawai]